MDELIDTIASALKSVRDTRFFNSERGFQGQFHVELVNLIKEAELLPKEAIVEEEYQKTRSNHGITYRPDLIVHIPFETGLTRNRKEGNFVVFEFKLRANKLHAIDRFIKLSDYLTLLNYPLGILVNINDPRSFIELVPDYRIHVFNVIKTPEIVKVTHSYLNNEAPVVTEI